MGLEKQLADIQELEISPVEKTIERVVKYQGEIEENKQKTQENIYLLNMNIKEQIERYKELVKEKLPKIINNIRFLEQFICGIGDTKDYLIKSREDSINDICPKFSIEQKRGIRQTTNVQVNWKFLEKYEASVLCIREDMIGWERRKLTRADKYAFFIQFADSTKSLRNLEVINKGFYSNKWKGLFKAKTTDEFTEKYLRIIVKQLEEGGKSNLLYLPYLLNEIPNLLVDLYKRKKEKGELEKDGAIYQLEFLKSNIQSKVERIGQLKVSDIL